jgi:hypothetical protein
MSFVDFLTVSGAIAWLVLGWKAFHTTKGLLSRLRWALFGSKKKAKTVWRQG